MPHEICRRIVGDKSPDQLRGNESRCTRVLRQDVDHFLTIAFAARGDSVTEDDLRPRIVNAWTEREFTTQLRAINAPSRECPGDFLNISLRIPAIHSERVQFHQFAP